MIRHKLAGPVLVLFDRAAERLWRDPWADKFWLEPKTDALVADRDQYWAEMEACSQAFIGAGDQCWADLKAARPRTPAEHVSSAAVQMLYPSWDGDDDGTDHMHEFIWWSNQVEDHWAQQQSLVREIFGEDAAVVP